MRILLLRHAETSAPERFHGSESDVGLSDLGARQADWIAGILAAERPTVIVSSAMLRARTTAIPIARACGVPHEIVPELHERSMGPLSGVQRAEYWQVYKATKARWEAGDLDATHPGGESFAAIRARVLPPFLGLARRHRYDTIVVVAHGVVIRVLLSSLIEGISPANFSGVPIENVGIHDLRYQDDRWRLVPFKIDTSGRPSVGQPAEPIRW